MFRSNLQIDNYGILKIGDQRYDVSKITENRNIKVKASARYIETVHLITKDHTVFVTPENLVLLKTLDGQKTEIKIGRLGTPVECVFTEEVLLPGTIGIVLDYKHFTIIHTADVCKTRIYSFEKGFIDELDGSVVLDNDDSVSAKIAGYEYGLIVADNYGFTVYDYVLGEKFTADAIFEVDNGLLINGKKYINKKFRPKIPPAKWSHIPGDNNITVVYYHDNISYTSILPNNIILAIPCGNISIKMTDVIDMLYKSDENAVAEIKEMVPNQYIKFEFRLKIMAIEMNLGEFIFVSNEHSKIAQLEEKIKLLTE